MSQVNLIGLYNISGPKVLYSWKAPDSLRTWREKTPSSALEGAPELNFRAFPADPPTAWACLQAPMLSDTKITDEPVNFKPIIQ